MAPKKTSKQFLIDAKIMVDTNKLVTANSLEEALEQARNLSVIDFIDINGDHNDSSLEIRGVFES